MNTVRRVLALLIAVLITLAMSIAAPLAGPAQAGVRAAPAKPSGGGNDARGDDFYQLARTEQVVAQALKDGKLGKPSTNLGGLWLPGSAPPGMEQRHAYTLQQAWSVGEERNITLSYIPVERLKQQNPALYRELSALMKLDDSGYVLQAVGSNSLQGNRYGDRVLHTEILLLTVMALDRFVGGAERAGMSPKQIAQAWRGFVNGLPRGAKPYRDKLANGFELAGVTVGELELPDTTTSEKQPCGSVSDSGCSVVTKKGAAFGTDYKGRSQVNLAGSQVAWLRVQVMLRHMDQAMNAKQPAMVDQWAKSILPLTDFIRVKLTQKVKTAGTIAAREALAGPGTKMLTKQVGTLSAKGYGDAAKTIYQALRQTSKSPPPPQKAIADDAVKKEEKGEKAGKKTDGDFNAKVCKPGALGGRTGRPVAAALGALPAAPCGGTDKSAPSGLHRSIAAAAAGENGGIDFSSLDLRYMADKPTGSDSSSVRYAFSGKPTTGDPHVAEGINDVKQASDAFFVWLALPESSFWVNLNPDEPDRIMDAKMGTTDAGRVMLQADLGLKNADNKWLDPRNAAGKRFWDALEGRCFSFRLWIVPGRADVYDGGDELYIEKAPLKVMMEAQYFKAKGIGDLAGCAKQDTSADDHNEALYRSLILPKVEKMVNTDPKYAQLRRVYRSRIAAEWYRRRSAQHATAYKPIIDSGDIGQWRYRGSWKPEQTFTKYKGELGKHKVTLKSRRGDYIYKMTYTFGGVDWTHMPYTSQDPTAFRSANPALAARVARSMNGSVDDGGRLLLGGAVPVVHAGGATPVTSTPAFLIAVLALVGTPVVLLAGGVTLGITLTRRRRRIPNGAR